MRVRLRPSEAAPAGAPPPRRVNELDSRDPGGGPARTPIRAGTLSHTHRPPNSGFPLGVGGEVEESKAAQTMEKEK